MDINNVVKTNDGCSAVVTYRNTDIKHLILYTGDDMSCLNYAFLDITHQDNMVSLNNEQKMEITECIIRYKLKDGNSVLYPIEYGPYISANSTCCQNSCFLMGVGINDDQMNNFINEFKQSKNNAHSDKNFFSIVLHSDPQYNKKGEIIVDGHVSTLIVDCSAKDPKFYLLDTSENLHQKADNNKKPKFKKIRANTVRLENQEVVCLSSIPNEALQNGDCCTVWATVINAKLAKHNDVNDIINVNYNCLKSTFLQEIVDDVSDINSGFVNKQACENLKCKILETETQQLQYPTVQQLQSITSQNNQQEIDDNYQQLSTSTKINLVQEYKSEKQNNIAQQKPIQQKNEVIQIKDPNLTPQEREYLNNTFNNIRNNIAQDIATAKHTTIKKTQQKTLNIK